MNAETSEFGGRVALVTAAAGKGIGQAIARRLAAGGATVVVTDIHPARTARVAAEIAADHPGATVVGHPMDAGDRDQIDGVLAEVTRELGPVRILVNNASINLMRDAGGGSIVNIGSYAPDVGGFGLEAPYAITKGGLNVMTRSCAHEGGPHGIRANCISMGLVAGTKFVDDHPDVVAMPGMVGPLGALPDTADIAETAAFLASDRARSITGEIINVAGGSYMRT
jgi:NAD(P)-dependent dehydrogenase (short-subunit alcohol dehydrogenase family)